MNQSNKFPQKILERKNLGHLNKIKNHHYLITINRCLLDNVPVCSKFTSIFFRFFQIYHIKYTTIIKNIATNPVKVDKRNTLNIKDWKNPPMHF
jgi:hypothetical protein